MKKISTLFGALLLGASLTANAESVWVTVSAWDNEVNAYVPAAQSFESELTKSEAGIYTLTQFFNSGYPASFTFEMPETGGSSIISMAGNLDTSDTYPYLLTPEGNYMICYGYKIDGGADDWWAIYYPYVDTQYSYVYRYDMSNPDNIYEFYGGIYVSGFYEDNSYTPWYLLEFFFNEPEVSAIKTVVSDADAPAVYYNLQGVRIDNPESGLFIRRQGDKTEKVILR